MTSVLRTTGEPLYPLANTTEYFVTQTGKLYRQIGTEQLVIEPNTTTEYPYWLVHTDTGWKRVYCHRLMAEMFVVNDDPATKKVVNHLDGNKMNYQLTNLEWCSQSENIYHAQRTGLVPKTTAPDKVKQIKSMLAQKKTNKEISDETGVSQQTVCNIRHGRRHPDNIKKR